MRMPTIKNLSILVEQEKERLALLAGNSFTDHLTYSGKLALFLLELAVIFSHGSRDVGSRNVHVWLAFGWHEWIAELSLESEPNVAGIAKKSH